MGKLPTVDELLRLVNDKLITQEEAKEILFNESDIDERDKKSLEEEIKFLRKLAETLVDNDRAIIVEKIKWIEKPYYSWDWWKPYQYWCTTTNSNDWTFVDGSSVNLSTSLIDSATSLTNGTASFSSIQTF